MNHLSTQQMNRKINILLQSNKRQMAMAICRCLMPDSRAMIVRSDRNRLKDELVFMRYYGLEENNKSLIAAITPIVLVNRNPEVILEEMSFLFTQVNGKEPSYYEKILLYLLMQRLTEGEAKAAVLAWNPTITEKEQIIAFQKAKIKILMELDKKDISLLVIEGLYCEQSLMEQEKDLLDQLSTRPPAGKEDLPNPNPKLLEFFSDVRNYRLTRYPYKDQGNPMAVIEMIEGKTYRLPPLGEVKIAKKTLIENVLTVDVIGRTENYTFRYRKNNG